MLLIITKIMLGLIALSTSFNAGESKYDDNTKGLAILICIILISLSIFL